MNERGALSLPLSLLLVAIAGLGLGTWQVLHHWRAVTELQLRLDDCVGREARALRDTQARIEAGNGRLRKLRVAQSAAWGIGHFEVQLRPLMEIEVAHQIAEQLVWAGRRATWLARRGCGESDWPRPLPSLEWTRPPEDPVGPWPLSWTGASRELRVELMHPPRAAAAVVYDQNEEMSDVPPAKNLAKKLWNKLAGGMHWHARWAAPSAGLRAAGSLGTIFD